MCPFTAKELLGLHLLYRQNEIRIGKPSETDEVILSRKECYSTEVWRKEV